MLDKRFRTRNRTPAVCRNSKDFAFWLLYLHFSERLQTILERIFVKTKTKTILRMSSVYKHKAPVRGKVWRRKLSLSLGRGQLLRGLAATEMGT